MARDIEVMERLKFLTQESFNSAESEETIEKIQEEVRAFLETDLSRYAFREQIERVTHELRTQILEKQQLLQEKKRVEENIITASSPFFEIKRTHRLTKVSTFRVARNNSAERKPKGKDVFKFEKVSPRPDSSGNLPLA